MEWEGPQLLPGHRVHPRTQISPGRRRIRDFAPAAEVAAASASPSTYLYCASSSFVVTGSASLLWSMDALIFDGDGVIL
jgi:hypothetical protein